MAELQPSVQIRARPDGGLRLGSGVGRGHFPSVGRVLRYLATAGRSQVASAGQALAAGPATGYGESDQPQGLLGCSTLASSGPTVNESTCRKSSPTARCPKLRWKLCRV